ncbi:MAG: hypothetical protein IJY24_06630 [Clostridia bacterium]|nr:hypothetical protein [Clostridia bacterium]
MSNVLKVGDTVGLRGGQSLTVTEFIGTGKNFFLYRVAVQEKSYLLRWYKSSYLDSLDVNELEQLYTEVSDKYRMLENTPKAFILPIDVTSREPEKGSSFGYILEEIDTGEYIELTDYFLFRTCFASFDAMLRACMNLTQQMFLYHLSGYVLRCLDNSNIFIHPESGEVKIAFDDDLFLDGENKPCIGKASYSAPELVMGGTSDRRAMRFTLAIILFRLMMGGQHPLEGVNTEMNDDSYSYGLNAEFIFDPDAQRNAADPEIHKNAIAMWSQYPEYIHEMFLAFFGKEGISSPDTRPIESDMLDALLRLYSETVECPKCREARVLLSSEGEVQCPKCGASLDIPCKIRFLGTEIPLIPGRTVYRSQFDSSCDNFNSPVFKLLVNKDRTKIGFGNMMKDTPLVVSYPDGTKSELAFGEVAEFKPQMTLGVGNFVGQVVK